MLTKFAATFILLSSKEAIRKYLAYGKQPLIVVTVLKKLLAQVISKRI